MKATAYRDVIDILKTYGWYREENHNKTEHTYRIGGSEIEFISIDEPQKIRGRKRKNLWINEANELSYEDFRQLILRTTGQIFADFNPSDEYHWIYDHVMTRDDCEIIMSTYKDNPFLDEVTIKEIERLKDTDSNYWKIYGLGERGISVNKIYSHWKYCEVLPEGGETIYGLDFGFNKPSALMKVKIKDDDVFAQEKLYESFLTNADLIKKLKGWDRCSKVEQAEWIRMGKNRNDLPDLGISYDSPIYADSAEPQRIEEILREGFNIMSSNKEVNLGIDAIKRRKFSITKESVNALKEAKSYAWKTNKDGKLTDEPVKVNDHAMDAIRYAVHTYTGTPDQSVEFL